MTACSAGTQVGWADGAGLGAGRRCGEPLPRCRKPGDRAQDPSDGDDVGDIVDTEAFPDASGNSGGGSWEVDEGQFANLTDFADTVATTEVGRRIRTRKRSARRASSRRSLRRSPTIGAIQGSSEDASPVVERPDLHHRGCGPRRSFHGQPTRLAASSSSRAPRDENSSLPTGDGDATSDGIFVEWTNSTIAEGPRCRHRHRCRRRELRATPSCSREHGGLITGSGFGVPLLLLRLGRSDLHRCSQFEAVEGMRVSIVEDVADPFGGTIAVTENFNLGRFGEVEVAPEVNIQPTQIIDPGQPGSDAAIQALADQNDEERITIDDGRSDQNPPSRCSSTMAPRPARWTGPTTRRMRSARPCGSAPSSTRSRVALTSASATGRSSTTFRW